jgi:hypothetical protein
MQLSRHHKSSNLIENVKVNGIIRLNKKSWELQSAMDNQFILYDALEYVTVNEQRRSKWFDLSLLDAGSNEIESYN